MNNNIVIADSSGIIMAYDDRRPEAGPCREALEGASLLVVSPLVLAETDHIATRQGGRFAARRIVSDICLWARTGRIVLPTITAEVMATSEQVRDHYGGLDLDLADAVNVALAAQYRTDTILTLDRRDFRAIRPLTPHNAFRILPDDR